MSVPRRITNCLGRRRHISKYKRGVNPDALRTAYGEPKRITKPIERTPGVVPPDSRGTPPKKSQENVNLETGHPEVGDNLLRPTAPGPQLGPANVEARPWQGPTWPGPHRPPPPVYSRPNGRRNLRKKYSNPTGPGRLDIKTRRAPTHPPRPCINTLLAGAVLSILSVLFSMPELFFSLVDTQELSRRGPT